MKFFIVKMLITVGVLVSTPMIYMGKFDPLAFFDSGLDEGVAEFNKLKAKTEGLSKAVVDEKVQVYKWRDDSGVMQFSSLPPPTVSHAERVELDLNSNLMQAIKIPEKKEEPKKVAKTERPNPYSFKGMEKTIDDAKGVEDMLQQRHEKQMEILGNI